MDKQAFLARLRQGLAGLPSGEAEERLSFYDEMLADRVEEGLSEEQAVAEMGDAEELILNIIADVPLTKLMKEKIRPKRRLGAWEIVLLAVGAPLWIPLLIASVAVAFSLFVSLWAVVGSLWAVPFSLGGMAVGGMASGIVSVVADHLPAGLCLLAATAVCVGLAIFAVYGCEKATKGAVWLVKKMVLGIKTALVRKGEA